MHVPDFGYVDVVLGTIAANRLEGDAVSLLLVGPPSSGKSEAIQMCSDLAEVHSVSTITVPGLLSVAPTAGRSGGTGGLLAEIDKAGGRGVIAFRDFSTMIESHSWGEMSAALRDVTEGHLSRAGGADGGKRAHFRGHVAVLGGVTEAVDRLGSMSELGDRLILCRMPPVSAEDEAAACRKAGARGDRAAVRRQLAATVRQFFEGLDLPDELPNLSKGDDERLIALAELGARCRSAVPRDGYTREQEDIPGHERAPRLFLNLRQLLAGMEVIGVEHDEQFRIIAQVALDGMKAGRRKVLSQLVDGSRHVTDVIAMRTGLSRSSAQRHLEDLAAHHIVDLVATRPPQWEASAWLRAHRWAVVGERKPEPVGELLSLFPGAVEIESQGGDS
jgi:DNA-binding transcriptional ArsR family regulator